MGPFQKRPLNEGKLYQTLNKNPLLFGIPFCLLMVGASYAMVPIAQTRYDLHDKKVKVVRVVDSGVENRRTDLLHVM